MSKKGEYDLGMLVLVANAHYKQARIWTVICAWLFGRHACFVHLGRSIRISFYGGLPYLLWFSDGTSDAVYGEDRT